jgi:hypothetical protein
VAGWTSGAFFFDIINRIAENIGSEDYLKFQHLVHTLLKEMAVVDKPTTARASKINGDYSSDLADMQTKAEWEYLKNILPYAPIRWANEKKTQAELIGKIVTDGCKIQDAGRMVLVLLNRAYYCIFPMFTNAKKNGTDIIVAISKAYAEHMTHSKLLVIVKAPQQIQSIYFTRRICMMTYVPKDPHILNKAILTA